MTSLIVLTTLASEDDLLFAERIDCASVLDGV